MNNVTHRRFNRGERVFLDRVALTMRDLNMAPAEAMQHVLGRDRAISKFFATHADARRQLARSIYHKLRRMGR